MLPQKRFFVKRPRWQIVAPVVLGMVLLTAVILSVFSQSEEKGYLPVIFQGGQPGTPTATSTAVPPCSVYFVDEPQAGEDNVLVSGGVGSIVSIVNLTTGETMGTDSLTTTIGYNCPGAADYGSPYQLSALLTGGHELQAQSDDSSADTAVVFPTPIGPSPTPTSTATPTDTPTPSPICGVQFEGLVIETQDFVQVTGDVGTIVTIVDLTDGSQQIGIGTMEGPFGGHACPGFVTISVPEAELVTGHVIAAISSDGTTDTTIVLGAPPTTTPTPTFTPQPPPTLTPSPTTTPGDPYIVLFPTCGTPNTNPGLVQFSVAFVNWPTNASLSVLWDGILLQLWQAGQHAGTFSQAYTRQVPQQNVTYMVTAVSGNGSTDSKPFVVPCTDFPTPTPGSTATQTPVPSDLVAYGPPQLISTPPIVAYQPVQFRVPITNTGDIDVNSQFFVDIYLDPNPETVLSMTIPITESDGYSAVSHLEAGASKIVTITAQLGYGNSPADHHTYAFVDSLEQVVETDETNNITDPLTGIPLTPAATPTPVITLTPVPLHSITGLVYTFEDGFQPQFRAQLQLIDEATGQTIATGMSDITGAYAFLNLPATTTYRVEGCLNMDGVEYFGYRTHLTPPQNLTYISLLARPCPFVPMP